MVSASFSYCIVLKSSTPFKWCIDRAHFPHPRQARQWCGRACTRRSSSLLCGHTFSSGVSKYPWAVLGRYRHLCLTLIIFSSWRTRRRCLFTCRRRAWRLARASKIQTYDFEIIFDNSHSQIGLLYLELPQNSRISKWQLQLPLLSPSPRAAPATPAAAATVRSPPCGSRRSTPSSSSIVRIPIVGFVCIVVFKRRFYMRNPGYLNQLWTAITQLGRCYQSRKLAQNASLLPYFTVTESFWGYKKSSRDPFQYATSTVQMEHTMKTGKKCIHQEATPAQAFGDLTAQWTSV
jgi:hypothetical protein